MNIKRNIKKIAMAGTAAAVLATFSMPSHAMRETDAGEANLVPFALWDNCPIPGPNGQPCTTTGNGQLGINTIVKITVPSSVGADVIPNDYTAPWTTPTSGSGPGVTPVVLGPQGNSAFTGTNTIHWHFLDIQSNEITDGTFPVTTDDVYVFDLGAALRLQGKQQFSGQPGYLVFNTEKADNGLYKADFSFFADAWMIAGLQAGIGGQSTTPGGVIGLIDAKIPVIPMSDGADPVDPVTNLALPPSVSNQTTSLGYGVPVVSPLVGGIRTNWADGNPTEKKVVDVTLGNRYLPLGNLPVQLQVPTLVVVWNDRNSPLWSKVPVHVFNDQEESCSDSVSLPNQLNLIWVQNQVTYNNPDYPVPDFITNNAIINNQVTSLKTGTFPALCVPPYSTSLPPDFTNLQRMLEGGFIKFDLPEPIDRGSNSPESSAVFFSIPLQYIVTAGGQVDISLVPFSTALGHDRGMFSAY